MQKTECTFRFHEPEAIADFLHIKRTRERTRLSGGFVGRPRCDVARDLLGQLFQLLASPALGGAKCGRVGLVPALLLAIGTHRFGVIRLPTIRQ